MFDLPVGFALGYLAGYLSHWWQAQRPARPARLVYGYTSPVMAMPTATLAEQWRINISAFMLQADLCGLTERRLVQAGVCSARGYREYARLLKSAGIWVIRERSETRWAAGWCGARARVELRRRRLSLPYPAKEPPLLYKRAGTVRS